jgi:predicted transcriptional regulator
MKTMKQILCVLLSLVLLLAFAGCKKTDAKEATKLSFQAASGYEYLKTLDGTQVTISGYMATSSPVDGSFMFLMNLPYQSCPFCVPNTSQLSNTMEVYPKKGEAFAYTSQAIKIVGTLVVAEREDEPFTDKYGYQFNYKIVDATYTIIQADELSAEMALWQKIAETDVVSEIYRMYDYVNFLCAWNTYIVESSTDENGNVVPGYYLFPEDATYFITTEGAQYNYGYKDGYFDSIIAKIEQVDPTAFADLVANVQDAEALAKKALAELENENYTAEKKFLEKFGTEDFVYTLNKGKELTDEMNRIYTAFANWIGSWEM